MVKCIQIWQQNIDWCFISLTLTIDFFPIHFMPCCITPNTNWFKIKMELKRIFIFMRQKCIRDNLCFLSCLAFVTLLVPLVYYAVEKMNSLNDSAEEGIGKEFCLKHGYFYEKFLPNKIFTTITPFPPNQFLVGLMLKIKIE